MVEMNDRYEPVKQVVFPVAGLGTRFLPATKNTPKEMLPLIDRPIIHHGVDEAVASGCTDIIFVTGVGKESIRNYFENSNELVSILRERGKTEMADAVESIHTLANYHYALQDRPRGLGDAVLCAEKECYGNFFGLFLPDDVMISEPTALSQLEAVRKKFFPNCGAVLCLEQVPDEEVSRYGIVDAEEVEPGIFKINGLVEKPKREEAPSNLAIMGRYLLSPSIFTHLKNLTPGAGGEYQLTDGISSLLEEEPVYGVIYNGRRLDCGTKEGWIRATIDRALADYELRSIVLDTFKDYMMRHEEENGAKTE